MVKAVNTVTGVFGHKGGGKTTTLALFLFLENIFNPDKPIYTNFWVSFDHKMLNGNDIIHMDQKLVDTVIGINELHEYADSRNSGSLQNKIVSDFFLQSRKIAPIYYDTQFKDQVDKRIRRITDVDIVSENLYIDSDRDGDDDLFKITVTDRRFSQPPKSLIYYAKPVFDMFDSSKRTNPFLLSKKEAKLWVKKHEKQEDE
jgi:hypothetical protein